MKKTKNTWTSSNELVLNLTVTALKGTLDMDSKPTTYYAVSAHGSFPDSSIMHESKIANSPEKAAKLLGDYTGMWLSKTAVKD